MAAALTLMAQLRSGPDLAGQLLLYPIIDAGFDTDSYRTFAEGYYLRRDAMRWFWDQYIPDGPARAEITASPLRASTRQLSGLPKALVITAEYDPLRDEAEEYAARLKRAGVTVKCTRYEGVTHAFTGMAPILDKGRQSIIEAAAALHEAFCV